MTRQEKKAQQILDDYFENTLGSRLNAKLGAELCVKRILSAIEDIEDFDKVLFEDELSDHYTFWHGVQEIIKKSR